MSLPIGLRRLLLVPLALLLMADSPFGGRGCSGPGPKYLHEPMGCAATLQVTGQAEVAWDCSGTWGHMEQVASGGDLLLHGPTPSSARPAPSFHASIVLPVGQAATGTSGFGWAATTMLHANAELVVAGPVGYAASLYTATGEGTLEVVAASPPAGTVRFRMLPFAFPDAGVSAGPANSDAVLTVAFTRP